MGVVTRAFSLPLVMSVLVAVTSGCQAPTQPPVPPTPAASASVAAAPPPTVSSSSNPPSPEAPPESPQPLGERATHRPFRGRPLVVISDDPSHCPAPTIVPAPVSVTTADGQCVQFLPPSADDLTRVVFAPVVAPRAGSSAPIYRMCVTSLGKRQDLWHATMFENEVVLPIGSHDLPGGRAMRLQGIPDSTHRHQDRNLCEPGVVEPVAHLHAEDPLPTEMPVSAMRASRPEASDPGRR